MAISTEAGAPAAAFTSRRWNADHPLVRIDRTDGPLPSVQVRHVGYPFVCEWATAQPDIEGLLAIAHTYLTAVQEKLCLHDARLIELAPPSLPTPRSMSLRWMRDATDPNHSQWIERGGGGAQGDRTALLLADLYWNFPLIRTSFALGGQGLRLLAQVSPARQGRVTVRIVGVVSTVPPLPTDRLLLDTLHGQWQAKLQSLIRLAESELPPGVVLVEPGLAIEVDMSRSDNVLAGLTIQNKTAIVPPMCAAGSHSSPDDERDSMQLNSTSHVIRAHLDRSGKSSITKQPLITYATIPLSAYAYVLASDPVSQLGLKAFVSHRPNRSRDVFDGLRSRQALGDLPSPGVGMVELDDAEVRVRRVRLVDAPVVVATPKVVPANSDASVRSNGFTAVSAFFHVRTMFQRMRDHGLDSAAYFRFADLPIDVHYRAGILPGRGDGRTVNAQVRWTIEAEPPAAPASGGVLTAWDHSITARRLELRFALGDQQRAAGRLPANLPSAVEREPLGVAADVRWCWHEFGHVLIAAATGALELPFAHSVGDALAAIACDPDSALACDADGASDNAGAWRYLTFPWVFIPRRHDRDVQRGWSWSAGEYGFGAPYGYRSEQLLSTTLFRLYRALGGDCMERNDQGARVPARDERKHAAQYSTYLIMRTLAALGPANVSPCLSVHQFVHAMRTVDAFTANTPGPGGYIGGSANKVIQWAFEQQGLYGRPVPGASVMGPEADRQASLQVDLHVEDRRVQSDGPYTPVDLLGETWQAAPDSITAQRIWTGLLLHRVLVRVDNRGPDPAARTRIKLWHARYPVGSTIPPFPGPAWKRIWVLQPPGTVPGANGAIPGHWRPWPIFWLPPVSGRYLLLLEASCAADRSNIDPATQFPCAAEPGQVARLVAFDNNLGLAVVTV